jgi:L-ascorbate metabolism protein UlaG (beta-lactamase superfamily)
MRLKLGRPDLDSYAARFDVPGADAGFAVTFLGVTSLLLDDGGSRILTDGFFSRPSLLAVGSRRIAPDRSRIDAALDRVGVERLDAVVPLHTHYDHAMDSAVVAARTDAVLAGGGSAAELARGHGLGEDRIHMVHPRDTVTFGSFRLTWVLSDHCPPDRYPGPITEPVVPPARVREYRCGEAWSLLVEHRSGRTALIQGSAGFVPGSLAGRRAAVAYLGVGQLGLLPASYLRAYWAETVEAVGARRVVLVHWDDFFRPLDRPLRALPFAGDDLDATMRVLGRLADQQDVALHLPTLWRREDPWASLA